MFRFVKTVLLLLLACACVSGATWSGVLRDDKGHPLAQKTVTLHRNQQTIATAATDTAGKFTFVDLVEGSYSVSVGAGQGNAAVRVDIPAGDRLDVSLSLQLVASDHLVVQAEDAATAGAEQRLSSTKVSGLPLNKRDFSQLLLLASGAQTDTNGAANFTAQFAVNGWRVLSQYVFAAQMASIPAIPEGFGGATFLISTMDARSRRSRSRLRRDTGGPPVTQCCQLHQRHHRIRRQPDPRSRV